MKKGIECWCDWKNIGAEGTTNVLHIEKKHGKLTLDEIRECCQEYSWNYWYLLIDARGETDEQFGEFAEQPGDFVMCVDSDNVKICTLSEKMKAENASKENKL